MIAISLLETELTKTSKMRLSEIVVMDVDTAVLNWQLNITDISQAHPKAHILMSGDTFDSANTGVIIIRCSKWSLEFLHTWWALRFDFPSDQQALSSLLATLQNTKKSKERVKILPSYAVNTPYPVYSANVSSLSILHVMGEPNEVRRQILSRAVSSLCDFKQQKTKHKSVPSSQLGISQALVVSAITSHRLAELDSSLAKCDDFVALKTEALTDISVTVTAEDIASVLQTAHAKVSHVCSLASPSPVMAESFCSDYGVLGDGAKCDYVVSFDDGSSVNITDKCMVTLDRMVEMCQKFISAFPNYKPLLLEQLAKATYDKFLMGKDTADNLDTGRRVCSISINHEYQ
jgi:hypothetical protein